MRHSPNLRRYARARPHRWHRATLRLVNFGFRLPLSIQHFFAIGPPSQATSTGVSPRNGMPISRNSAMATSSRFASVTIVMSIPWIRSTLS